jgi:hypothetical protein
MATKRLMTRLMTRLNDLRIVAIAELRRRFKAVPTIARRMVA